MKDMIIKKPPKKEHKKSTAQQISDLVDYIREPHKINPEEKVEYSNAKNFLSTRHNSQKLEMISSAAQSKHSKMPVTHWIMSWHEDEHPTYDQIDKCVDIFLAGMGLEGHQVVYGLHKDTKVCHLHIAVNRMNEESGKVIEVNKGFDREAAHRVIAKIEALQGWRPEKNSRYVMLENGEIVRAKRKQRDFKPKSKASDFEHARGEKSAQRIAHERGHEILSSATTWKELHEKLAQVGLRLEKKGPGAILWAGDVAVKASSVDRKFSMGNLTKRLGTFEPGIYSAVPEKILEPVSQVNLEEWKEYQKEKIVSNPEKEVEHERKFKRKPYLEIPRPLSQNRMRGLSTCHMAQNGKRAEDILCTDARPRGRSTNALRWEIHHFPRRMKRKKLPRFVTWLKNMGKEKQAELWRHRSLFEKEAVQELPEIEAYSGTEKEIFEKYAAAVQADTFRVTCIKMLENGEKKAFILGKSEGVSQGFSSEELVRRMAEIVRIQARDENIYYTPLSKGRHHILIDDMSEDSLRKFWKDGYRPAIVLRSSPGNFQCVLTIKKLGTEFDRDIGNRLAERLNREYGDKKLSGCIHPHRAPGFENRKPKHRREDGQYPTVKLLYAERRECGKTIKLSEEIAGEIEQATKAQRERRKEEEKKWRNMARPGSPIAAYHAHLANIRQHMTVEDASRVDSMIALRMRATGHDQGAIENAIRTCAREMRGTEERRDWSRYAERTAAYAFSVAADHSLERHKNYVEHWRRIEGIEPEKPQEERTTRQRRRMR